MNSLTAVDFTQPHDLVKTNNQSYIVCCFYTPSYEKNIRILQESLNTLNINYYLQPIEDQGYWEANTRIKPHFLLHCLQNFQNLNILYLDADAVVRKQLDYFNDIQSDIAVYKSKGQEGMSHDHLTGTIFLKNSITTHKFVKQWIKEQDNCNQTMVDQDSFDKAMEVFRHKLKITSLPLGYIKIFDKDYEGEVYIEQFQASRNHIKLKRKLIRRRNKYLIGFVLIFLIALFVIILVKY